MKNMKLIMESWQNYIAKEEKINEDDLGTGIDDAEAKAQQGKSDREFMEEADKDKDGAPAPPKWSKEPGKKAPKWADQDDNDPKVGDELEEGMPSSVAKHKQQLADMSDEEFAEKHGDKSEEQLRQMAWRHGYGKMSPHYWNRVKKT
tara:strand:+ start:182 stop:622 length:441 start_codon:yes stop_codon:yes gene_type:complete